MFGQPADVVAYLLQRLLAGPRASPRRRIGGEESLHLGQLLGRGEVGREDLRYPAQGTVSQPKPSERRIYVQF